jgi:hypothetical protein
LRAEKGEGPKTDIGFNEDRNNMQKTVKLFLDLQQQFYPLDKFPGICNSLTDFLKSRPGIKAVLIVLPQTPHTIKL